MSTDFDRPYEVLGVKPGVSDRELKAAHRDLAKVWHPDRFGHDPRLQEKAQEKLKEINEAYEQLISRHTRRVTPPPRRPRAQASNDARAWSDGASERSRRGVGWHWWVAAPLALFALVFAFTTKTLLRDRQRPVNATEITESNTEPAPRSQETTRAVRSRSNQVAAAEPAFAPNGERVSEPPPANEAIAPVATVTVSIDPASGLLATPTCPVKTRMTYPSGSEPRAYCNVSHVVKTEKETGIKRLAKRIL